MKTWPRYSRNLLCKFLSGMVTLTVPVLLFAQSTPLSESANATYPGVLESMRLLLDFDSKRMEAKRAIVNTRTLNLRDIETDAKLDLDPDFLNSIMLNTPSSYMALAGQSKCAFYSSLLADLLKSRDGKLSKLMVQYQRKDGTRISGVMDRRDFIEKAIYPQCPEMRATIALFQVKTIDQAIRVSNFNPPTGRAQCEQAFSAWVQDAKAPFWCQIDEVMKTGLKMERKTVPADSNAIALGRLLRQKLGAERGEYLSNFCANADSQQVFCANAFSTSFFTRITDKSRNDIYIKDVCQEALAKNVWSPLVAQECIQTLKANPDACMWSTTPTAGLSPRAPCDQLSLALNNSTLWAEYDDCPRFSDNQAITNTARLLLNIERPTVAPNNEPCSAVSAATVLDFNRRFDNETMWSAGVCYLDKIEQKEKCVPAFYGDYGVNQSSIGRVIGEVLTRTRGAERNTVCKMVSVDNWNGQLLEYKYGCFIVYDPDNCGFASCNTKIYHNEREVKDIKVRSQLAFDYFPNSIAGEKFSQTYVIQRDAQKKTRALQTLPMFISFFKENPKGIVHGIGCAEDLLPGFFKKVALNQCTPLPFIIDGIIQHGDRATLVTRSAADDVHAPRLLSWGQVFSAVKSYQLHQPLKQWTMNAIY